MSYYDSQETYSTGTYTPRSSSNGGLCRRTEVVQEDTGFFGGENVVEDTQTTESYDDTYVAPDGDVYNQEVVEQVDTVSDQQFGW